MNQPEIDMQHSSPLALLLAHEPEEHINGVHEAVAEGKRKLKVAAIVLAVIVAINVGVGFMAGSALVSAKMLITELMLALALICLMVAWFHKVILHYLALAELIGDEARIEAIDKLAAARVQLDHLARKLSGEEDQETVERWRAALPQLLKTVGPVVMMFVQKEKSIIQWGMLGLKIAKGAIELWKERSKNS